MINIKELMDVYMDEDYTLDRVFRNDKCHNGYVHTPFKYDGIYEYIGYVDIWNEIGCVENTFEMYRPVKGHGTILYDDGKGF